MRFEESYHLKVDYSCEYEIENTKDNITPVKIKCRFRDYFPLSRDYIDTEPVFFSDHKPLQEDLDTYRYRKTNFKELNFEIIKDFAWESEKIYRDEKGRVVDFEPTIYIERGGKNDDGKWVWRSFNPNIHAIVVGFESTLFFDKRLNVSEEMIHKRVKELVENSVALITHSPLVKLYRRYEHSGLIEAGIIIDSEPEWIPSFNYHKNVSNNDKGGFDIT